MAGLKEIYCRSNETSLGSQFKWLEYTFNVVFAASCTINYLTIARGLPLYFDVSSSDTASVLKERIKYFLYFYFFMLNPIVAKPGTFTLKSLPNIC